MKNLRAFRRSFGLNQADFWSRIGITQSGGSRYETSTRAIPKTVALLLRIAYGTYDQCVGTMHKLRRGR